MKQCQSKYRGSATRKLYRCELDAGHSGIWHTFTFHLSETLTRIIRWDD